MDTLERPKSNTDKAMVGSDVCTLYTDGQPYKPCVLCQTGFRDTCFSSYGDIFEMDL